MTLRILHTSDWHLGHTLHDLPRTEEHAAFLAWLLGALDEHAVDALLVAGDVFDTANPSAEAQAQFHRFLVAAKARRPSLDIVVIGGNHDSAARLDATAPILDELGVHVVGGLPSNDEASRARLVVPLRDAEGAVAAWAIAVPFLRPADLPYIDEGDALVEGVRTVYGSALELARTKRSQGQALVAMGHCYMTGSSLSELSERRILGGNQHALPVDVFPHDLAYVALGHLHLAQRVGGRENVRYAGSPIPLSIDEERYEHQVVLAELEGEGVRSIERLFVPRTVPILRVPSGEPRSYDELEPELHALSPRDPSRPDWQRPYLEVHIRLDTPDPSLRAKVEAALEGKDARLVRLRLSLTGSGAALGDTEKLVSLVDLSPEQVFLKRYERDHASAPDVSLLDAFAELEASAREER
jgi:exonuclease SbcD